MKAWIAFNAWYESGEIEGKTDKDKIDYIAYRSNRFKTYIENLLTSEDTEGISFRESVGICAASIRSSMRYTIPSASWLIMRHSKEF